MTGRDIVKKLAITTSATAVALALWAPAAMAAGLDRSGHNINVLFSQGSNVELSFGMVSPSITGSVGGGALPSGDMAPSYSQFSIGLKSDINEKLSLAIIMDQPWGADVAYPASAAPYPFAGTTAQIDSNAIALIARYRLSSGLAVHAGIRHETLSGSASIPLVGGYTLDASSNGGTGYLLGVSYEKPEIALRVDLTYNSAISQTLTGTEFGALPTSFTAEMPRSVNLNFQSGIAADTLLFGSVRWVNQTALTLAPPAYVGATSSPLLSYANDSTSYSLGIGRRFSDSFSGSIALGYEAATGLPASNFAPVDGSFSIQIGGKYTRDNMTIKGGIRYVKLGDATTSTVGASFSGNSAIGIGISVGYSF